MGWIILPCSNVVFYIEIMGNVNYIRVLALFFIALMGIPQIAAAAVTSISISANPTLNYEHGAKLDLSVLEVTLSDEDDEPIGDPIGVDDFGTNSITIKIDNAEVAINETLTHVEHDGKSIVVVYDNDIEENIGTLEVAQRNLSNAEITVTSSHVYDGTAQTPTIEVSDDGATITTSDYDASSSSNTNAGTATVTLTATPNGNYTGEKEETFQIAKKALTITADSKTITYGDNPPEYTVTYSGFENDETKDNLTGDLEFDTGYDGSTVGTYTITPSGYSSSNYDITYATGTLTVAQQDLNNATITVTSSHVYDGTAQTPTIEVSYNGETIASSEYLASSSSNTNAGTATITLTATECAGCNYTGTKTTTFQITKKALTITVGDKDIYYGDPVPDYTATYDGFVVSDDENDLTGCEITSTYTPSSNVGEYPITSNDCSSSNYEITLIDGTLTVEPKSIPSAAITVTTPIRDNNPNLVATFDANSNFTAGAVTWTPSGSPFQGGVAYTATVTLTAKLNHEFASNVTATINEGNATVQRNPDGKEVTISYEFEPTSLLTVTGIAVTSQPAKLTYTHDEPLDLSGLVATLTYSDATTENVTRANFATKGITTSPANGTALSASSHNGTPVTVAYNAHTATTNNLTVNKAKIASVAVNGIVEPIIGETLSTAATVAGNYYTVTTVTWSPNEAVKANTPYKVTVALTATANYEFENATKEHATINGIAVAAANATVSSNNTVMTISHTFQSPAASVAAIEISKQPAKLAYAHGDTLDLSGIQAKLTYNDATTKTVDFADFTSNSITTNPAEGDELAASLNGTSIEVIYNNSPTIRANTNALTVSKAKITTAEVIVTIPVADEPPSPEAITEADGNFTGAVAWSPNDNPFQGGVAYTATVTLTANADYEFATNFTNAKINGERATVLNNTGQTVAISHNFPQTPLIKVTGIEIKQQPANLAYTHGDALDLYGLAVTLAYSDNTTEDVSLANFASKGITTNPAYGAKLSASLNNNTRITVIYNNSPTIRTSTNALTVGKIEIQNAEIIVTPPAKNQVPSAIATAAAASEIDYAIGAVIWNPSHSTFQNGMQYVATVTLTAREGYAFTAKTIATFNGETAQATLGQGGATITLTHIFPKILADFILVNIGGITLDEPNGNKFAYVSPCGEDSASINIGTESAEDAIIIIDGKNTSSQDVKLDYGNNKVSITAIAPNSAQEYELTINKPFPDDAMIKVRWNNTLTVINNARYNNYDFESYKWYRNGMVAGTGRSWSAGASGEKLKPEDKYHVEATTKGGETIRSCEVTLAKQAQAYGIALKRNSENSFEFEVAAPEKSEIEIAVYDVAGNLVSKPTGNTIRNIPKGLYFVVAKAKGESGEVYHYSAKLAVKK